MFENKKIFTINWPVFEKIPIFFFLLLALFLVYLYSLCPTVYLIDSGELAAVSYTLGIAHPTGYPLYTLISYFFARLPGEPIKNLNLLSAIFSLSSALLLYLLVKQITKSITTASLITILFALSPIIWRISITNEVYSLTVLFSVLLLFLFYRLHDTRLFYAIMFFTGLSFTNHIIIFSLALPLIIYILLNYKPSFKIIIIGIIFSITGLSLYLYLIFRTLGGAEIAWGNTCNFQRLLWHITGKQYQVWMFSLALKEILNNAKEGLLFLTRNLLYFFLIPFFAGFYYLFKHDRIKSYFFLSIILLNFLYTINYAIPDIESYYIPCFITILLVCSYGFNLFKNFIRWFILVPVSIFILIFNYPDCTLRNNTFGLDYGYAHIAHLPEKSLLICSFWDIYSPTIYLRKVKNIRKDLIIIDKELLRRTWYIKYLKREYPEFYKSAEKEIEEYLVELIKFEYKKPYTAGVIQSKFIRMLERFVEVKETSGVYFALPFPDRDLNSVKPDYHRIPCGLNFLVTRENQHPPFDFSKLKIDHPRFIYDKRLKFNIETVKKMVITNINYLIQVRKIHEAEKAKEWLKNFQKVSSLNSQTILSVI
ncbi:MAG: DUF2723 domain-containing protein [candidate division WOR-3 bacterium]|nr:DUF2723 domain-containing protein [candidate division WOR-3 bacterium]